MIIKNTPDSCPTVIKRIHTGYAEHIHLSRVYFSISLLVCKSKWHTLCHVLSFA